MAGRDIIQVLLFAVFFAIGTAAMYVSIVCDEFVENYHRKQLLQAQKQGTEQLKSLNTDYDTLLGQLEKDPNLIKRIVPVTFGTEPEDEDTAYPKATPQQLDAARKVLTQDSNSQPAELTAPDWLNRCSQQHRRIILFLAGAFLILVSFIFFGKAHPATPQQ